MEVRHGRKALVAGRVLVALSWTALFAFLLLAGPPAPDITEITLERDCFGCPTGTLLVLRRDGTATRTTTGKARHATEDRTSQAIVRQQDCDALARLLLARGFFELAEEYDDPQLRDVGVEGDERRS